MIIGVGTDILEIARIAEAVEKGDRFLERFYTRGEQEFIRGRGRRAACTAAVNFAGKEAVAKALGTGIGREVRLEEIEILREPSGAPYVELLGGTLQYAASCKVKKIHISLSDTDTLAVAYAVAEGE